MSDPPSPSHLTQPLYHRLLVGTGGAPHSQLAVNRAAELALHFGAALHLVTVIPQGHTALSNVSVAFIGSSDLDGRTVQEDHERYGLYLRQTATHLRPQGVGVHEHLVTAFKPADALLEVAREVQADLILLGRRHKTAWSAALAGSVSDMVSHASPVDVLVVR